ncbi:MAG: condensation domain-containing protein, partial [Kangiellaceae bacterium]|nr:condensation domain-containing protein [Kangiellaceae bacterium]
MSVFSLVNKVRNKGIKLWQENGQLKFKAPKGALTQDIRSELIEKKSEIIEFLKEVSVINSIPPIKPYDRAEFERIPLSYSQEWFWFMNQLDPESSGYNSLAAVTLSGDFNSELLEQALNIIIERHEILRTVFPSENGVAQQVVLDQLKISLDLYDLSGVESRQVRDTEARDLCQKESHHIFDLESGPLLRAIVIRLSQDEHIFLINMHHIISDAWSIGIMQKEYSYILDCLSQSKPPRLPPLAIQYADYSIWQRDWLEHGGVLEQQLSYWQQKLEGVPETLDMPADFPRPAEPSMSGATHSFLIDSKLTHQLKTLADQNGCTLYMVCLAILKVLLHRYSGQEDICVGSIVANRRHDETQTLIGVFINTLALRSSIQSDDTFIDVLKKVQDTCFEAYENQDTPFEKVVDLVQPQRNKAVNPLYQIMMMLHNTPLELGENVQHYPLDSEVSNLDQIIELRESAEGLNGSIEYSTELYRTETIERMFEHFIKLCSEVVSQPNMQVSQFDFLSKIERQQLTVDFNDTLADYPKEKCIHEFFIEQVQATPQNIAATFEGDQLTYLQLYERSKALALYLQSKQITPDSPVGLFMERSLDMLVAIMGILQAGAAYVPLDPEYPDERLSYMLSDCGAQIVLTQKKLQSKLKQIQPIKDGLVVMDIQSDSIADVGTKLMEDGVEIDSKVDQSNLAYIIYTSGSTGQPKGVMVEHSALVNRIDWMQKQYPLCQNDVVLQKTPYSFDVSVWEFVWPMMCGASIVFAKPSGHKDVDYLVQLINATKVSTLHFVPSMLSTFLENYSSACNSVRQVFCSGEALGGNTVSRYKEAFPSAALHNLYGPTEAAIDVTYFDCSNLDSSVVPIGSPINNTQIYIL